MKCPYCGYDNMAGNDECECCEESLASLDGIAHQVRSRFEKLLMRDPVTNLNPRDAVSVSENVSLIDAIRKMNQAKVGCVMVTGPGGKLSGILTERDILFRVPFKGKNFLKNPVKNIMTTPVETLREEMSIASVLHQMSVKRFRHTPILRKNGSLGLLTARDLLNFLAHNLGD